MPYTVSASFERFIDNISLTGDHRDIATSRKDALVSLLENTFEIVDSFPTGSIPRYTALKGSADLDVMVVLGLLALYGLHSIGIDHPEVRWLPESEVATSHFLVQGHIGTPSGCRSAPSAI